MAGGEAATDRWRDEDGIPSPAEEFGPCDWWLRYEERSYPPDHRSYLRELYAEIQMLRAAVHTLEAELAAARRSSDDERAAA